MTKEFLCSALGIAGCWIASLFGGWDASIQALVIFMSVDYIMGFTCAAVFRRSPKSKTGALQSKAGWKGLCKKAATLLLVLAAAQLDAVLGTSYIRDAVCIAFMSNELISMLENVGIMGVKFPEPLRRAIEILQDKSDGGKDGC
jgi:toxin secretion/phage lysis holin